MCGRFNLTANAAEIEKAFDLFESLGDLTPRYNIAPTQQVLAIRQDEGKRAFCRLRWGLVPFWADDLKIGYKLINARADGIATKPSFRDALKKRRCLIPATGFYEWRTEGKAKRPFHVFRQDHRPFAFAGLWERWNKGDTPVESCTIVTTDANDFMKSLHTRMPVILDPKDYDLWLGPATEPAKESSSFCMHRSARDGRWSRFPPKVNNAQFDGPECVEPAA